VERVNRLLVAIALIAVAVRGLIPTGWMPTGERAFEITVCAGADTHKVWLDSKGKLHKQDPSKRDAPDPEPCAFSAISMAAALPNIDAQDFAYAPPSALHAQPSYLVSIGNGLAAPPPPATGPPILI
jgi:hypothetical protein